MAEDGRIYEKSATEEHFRSKLSGEPVKSPMTNEPMGRNLLPALQTKNLIETLIESGVITGEIAEKWKQKAREKEVMDELIQRAQSGDKSAMYQVGYNYFFGEYGFPQDYTKAHGWFQLGHEAGSIRATACLGRMLLEGRGVEVNHTLGLLYTSLAAAEGCDASCFIIGMAFANGSFGVPKNQREAER